MQSYVEIAIFFLSTDSIGAKASNKSDTEVTETPTWTDLPSALTSVEALR